MQVKTTKPASDKFLQEAIDNWHPGLPRRWLARYGDAPSEGNDELLVRYNILCSKARVMLHRPHAESVDGIASHRFHLD